MTNETHAGHKLVAVIERMPMCYPVETLQAAGELITYGNEGKGYAFIDLLANGYPEPGGWCETCSQRCDLPANFEGVYSAEEVLELVEHC